MHFFTGTGNYSMRTDLRLFFFSSLFLIAVSGIYVATSVGVRLDHLVVYISSVIIFLLFLFNRVHLCINREVFLILLSMLCLVALGVLVILFNGHEVSLLTILASLENYVQPIAIILIACFIAASCENISVVDLFSRVCRLFLIFLVFNVFLSFLLFYFNPREYLSLIGGSGSGDPFGMTVVERALLGGRNAGVFNQPIEGGVAYALGILVWIYLFKKNGSRLPSLWMILQFFIVIVGGILGGSKIFYIIGSVVALLFMLPLRNYVALASIKFIMTGVLVLGSFFYVADHWNGALPIKRGYVYFDRLLVSADMKIGSEKSIGPAGARGSEKTDSTGPRSSYVVKFIDACGSYLVKFIDACSRYAGKFINVYSSGRFSRNSTIFQNVTKILSESPVYGYGFGGYRTSDNGLLDVLSIGGLIGVFLYSALFVFVFYLGFTAPAKVRTEGNLLLAIWSVLLVSSAGAPILTANRIAFVIWIMTTLLVLVLGKNPRLISIKKHGSS